jgi:hypothetical protein
MRDCPDENSLGTSPTKEPMLFPVNLSESPTVAACFDLQHGFILRIERRL